MGSDRGGMEGGEWGTGMGGAGKWGKEWGKGMGGGVNWKGMGMGIGTERVCMDGGEREEGWNLIERGKEGKGVDMI